MISARGLTKRYGDATAVDDLSFDIQPGKVTGFLGPNGAGKTTTMRMILGLDRPSAGTVTVDGRAYRDLPAPMAAIGALLDAKQVHGRRTARDHLRWLAQAGNLPGRRVDEVLDQVGLGAVAGRKLGGFSLGMSQRLGIAAALLGDPSTVLFDEPVNGLDPEGIRWVRRLIRGLAGDGRTVVVSSHLMSEMEGTADHVLVIGRGALIADTGIEELTRRTAVRVVTPDRVALVAAVERDGGRVSELPDGALSVDGLTAAAVGDLAAAHQLRLHELTPRRATLEEAFMELTHDAVEYRTEEVTR